MTMWGVVPPLVELLVRFGDGFSGRRCLQLIGTL